MLWLGAYAEYIAVNDHDLANRSQWITFMQRQLPQRASRPGKRCLIRPIKSRPEVLIHGATGAWRIRRATRACKGIHVIGTASQRNQAYLKNWWRTKLSIMQRPF